ncbi:MAG: hypothetical protein EZS28_001926 [Streblomastix strix]|uniref:Uncharacterized protein n=1 Tax=Streblomastix strix TaxID=222440 RepID=A0A5J4X5N1_9EUKA|nr:MAG: hypothetical protein EZS28_001926 [Streblomastix strix]
MDDLSEIGFACINNNQSLINILKSNGSEYIKVIGSRLKDTLNEQIQTRKSSVKSSLQNSQHSHTSSITSSQQHVNQIPIITHVKQIYPLNEQDERKRIDNKLNKIGSKDNKEEKTEKEGMKSESIIKHHRSHSSDQTDGKDNKEKQIGQLSAIQQKVSSYTPQWTYSRKENLSEDQPKRIELPRSNLSSADSDVRSYQSTNSNKGSMKQSPKLKDNPNYHILKDLHSKGPFSDSPASLSSPQPITPGFNKNVNSAQYSSNMQPQSPNLYQTSISTPQPQHGQLEKAIQAEKELEREREKEKKEQEQDALTSNIQSELLNASKNLDQDKSQLKKKKVKDVDKDKDKNNQKNKTDEKEQNNSPSLIPEQPQSITKSEADKLKNRLKIFDIMQLQSLLLLHRYSPF